MDRPAAQRAEAQAMASTGAEATPLTPAQLGFFHAFGYLHLKAVFTPPDLAMLMERADELVAKSTLVPGEFRPRGPAADTEPYFMEPLIDRPHVLGAVTCVPFFLCLCADEVSLPADSVRGGEQAADGVNGRESLPPQR